MLAVVNEERRRAGARADALPPAPSVPNLA
jgi:hypothetical protein